MRKVTHMHESRLTFDGVSSQRRASAHERETETETERETETATKR
jgi:hypothetical protein